MYIETLCQSFVLLLAGNFPGSVIRVAHPTSDSLLFYAVNDTCLGRHCGMDLLMIEYMAQKLNRRIEYVPM
jgi:hypothetical protein